uniref:phosphatidylinositol 4-phosphate 3-kinase C2 domain-containing subunit gamma n=1 Tax=Jaculus jaculus TaxID=51337 RepID=UPI001E1B3FA2|nr:phosphatidylinositol 4-phosphate 3-kinase C2 domain-containing subunit gamma [Jaculus jaculus]
MAYSGRADPNSSESQQGQDKYPGFYPEHQHLPSHQVRLGFDQLVEEISNKIPLLQSEAEKDTVFVPNAQNLDSKWHSLDRTHQGPLNELSYKHPELSWHEVEKTSAIGFHSSLLPTQQSVDKENSWGNPIGQYDITHASGIKVLSPLRCHPQRELENENHNYHIGFENNSHSEYPSFLTDFLPNKENKLHTNVVEPSLMFIKDSFVPRAWENTLMEKVKPIGHPIDIVDTPQGSTMYLASFCDKVKKIRETYSAADIHSNSGRIWSIATAFPAQLFANTKFSINIFTDNSAQPLHLKPCANYLVKDLIAEILHLCANDQLFPKDHLLHICGSEEFLQFGHYLGSHRVFQKEKHIIQLGLQNNMNAPGKLSRTHEDDHSQFSLNQLLEFTYIWKVSKQCLLTVIKKYERHVQYLLSIQPFVGNIAGEVKNICSILGCIETKEITDAVNELNLHLQRNAEDFHQKSDTSKPGSVEEVTTELSKSIHQLIDVYCSSFYTDFRPVHASGGTSCVHTGLCSHLSFTVCALHNIPETWAHRYKAFSFSCWLTYAGKKLCQVRNYRTMPVKKSFFFLVNWNETINFPLELKSLPRESMLTIKLFGTDCTSHNSKLLAWTCLPLFPKEKSILGPLLLSMTFQSEPPIEMIAPGAWDRSQPSPLTLQIDFPAAGWEYVRPNSEESRAELDKPPSECLKHIARLSQKQSPSLLSEEKRRYIWFYRFYCSSENCSLPLVLGSAPGWDEGTVSKMHAILRRWTFAHPLEALGLLTSSFPDQEIRQVAAEQLNNLPDDELLEHLPQLVQAVKFEWSLESPLVELLLQRALQSVQVAHRLYWLLTDAENETYFKGWYQKLLAALQFCVGKALNDELSKERRLVKILEDIGDKVKSASDPQRQEVLKKEIGRLEEFFQDVQTCRLPLNPALSMKGIDRSGCSYFPSNALPLKITFINANPMGENVRIIFKAGDDVRQDMLVLQIIQVMDNMWLQEGLDMQMIIYKCLSTGKAQGLIQMVPDAVTLAKIHLRSGLIGPLKENTIKKWFTQHNPTKEDYEKALRNFFYSCAGWCVATFVLGVCDRHNDNIMLTKSGHMFHIDFGKFLGHAQTFGGIKRDRAPFIFTSEMEYFITEGGRNPQHFQDFVELCCRAYNIVRKHSQLLLNLLEMMRHAGFPELRGIEDLKYVYNNLRPQDTDIEATSHFTKMHSEECPSFQGYHDISQECLLYPQRTLLVSGRSAMNRNGKAAIVDDKNAIVFAGEIFQDKNPKIQLLMTYEGVKLTILVKHMKNIHLPDGSAPTAHVEFYLLPHPSEVRKRKTRSVPKRTDPTYNEIVVYDEVTELQGHVLMLIVKSKTVFVGAINIQLCSVALNEEKWYPLGNSII